MLLFFMSYLKDNNSIQTENIDEMHKFPVEMHKNFVIYKKDTIFEVYLCTQ